MVDADAPKKDSLWWSSGRGGGGGARGLGALGISGRSAHHRVARAVARLRSESVSHLFGDGRGDVHVRPVLAVYGHRHRERRPRPREERRGDARAARATRSTADGDVAGVTHRAGRHERRVSARCASGRSWGSPRSLREKRFASRRSVGRSSAPPDNFDRRGRSTSNRILQEKDLVRYARAFREPPA